MLATGAMSGTRLTRVKMHMASPTALPGAGVDSELGRPRLVNSLCRDFARLVTTRNCQIRLNKGTNKSHTLPDDMVLDSGEHRSKAR